ncbi:MFS general substrate transporter [Apiospora kogelbergensis]|uniref:MFS general substrate transporter n=1 Tax=Apiospora kogelbergensis TaxID=1337665 RepID=A0AAW0Q308_9PEZI
MALAQDHESSDTDAAKTCLPPPPVSDSPFHASLPEEGEDTVEKNDVGDAPLESYLQGWRLWLVYIATLFTMFLVPLDMTIVATAIPKITEEFQSLDEVGWYGSAFFLTLAIFQSPWGKLHKYYPLKWVYAASVLIFELGSLICGVSKNSQMLIAGRVITGCGGAGITIGTYVIITHLVPPSNAPAYIGGIGAAFSVASVAGPLVGGAFTGEATWRWCFYVNLPVGGTASLIFFAVFPQPTTVLPKVAARKIILELDPLGTALAVGSIICYFLALEWGGVSKPWDSADVIGTLVGWCLLVVAFGIVQWTLEERASIIPRILIQRNVAGGSAFMFLVGCANFLMIYNLPIYFQSVKGSSPTLSGVEVLPLIVSASVFVVLSGIAFTKFPLHQFYLVAGAGLIAIGAGLLYTLGTHSYAGAYLGYQFVVGIGNGVCQQIPLTIVQASSPPQDLATSMATVLLLKASSPPTVFQLLSGALSVAAAQSAFINRLLLCASVRLPDIDRAIIITTGATDLQRVFSGNQLTVIRECYLDGLRTAWAMAVVFGGLGLLVGLALGFGRVKKSAGN